MAEDRPTSWADVASWLSQLQLHHAAGEMTDDIQAIRAIAAMPQVEFMKVVGKVPEMTPVTYTEDGSYADVWAYPVRLEEARAILGRVKEIARGEAPVEDQKQWGFTIAVGIQALKKGQEETESPQPMEDVALPELNEAPLLWGDLGELLHFFAGVREAQDVRNQQCFALGDYIRRVIWNLVLDVERAASEKGTPPEPPPEPPPGPPAPPIEPPTEPAAASPPPPPPTGAPGDVPLETVLKEPKEPKPEITELKTKSAGPGQPCHIVLRIEIPRGAHLEISVTHYA
ncbi:MAG: hypothetical protein NT039_03805 [Candidatus Berkelbacteria bacterium]|nr:hypothetical protein [Candidatus Berkelbacteria bacterium]